MSINSKQIKEFLKAQSNVWDLARNNYEALENVRIKEFDLEGFKVKVQYNPSRIVSSGAQVDAQSIRERPCFLCAENRPAEQKSILYGDYEILVNPFPIFPEHFTIPAAEHAEQMIYNRFADMLDLAKALDEYVIFYNGPKCGASAPDHAHFQAGSKGFLPIEKSVKYKSAVIQSSDKESVVSRFFQLYGMLEIREGDKEPMMNILAWYEKGGWTVYVFPREKHRPDCYYAEGADNLLISPASADMGGVFITPLRKDFEKITKKDIEKILREVSMDEKKLLSLSAKLH